MLIIMLIRKANYLLFKKLAYSKLRVVGRNFQGIITIKHRGGSKVGTLYRVVDFLNYL